MSRIDRHRPSPTVLAAGALVLAAAAVPAQPASLQGSRITVDSASGGRLAVAIRRLGSGEGSRWIAWAAPAEDPRRQMCCFEGIESAARPGAVGRCRLDRERSFNMSDGDDAAGWRGGDEFFVFVRVRSGVVDRVRSFSESCRIEAGSAPVIWLEDVAAADSVAWLETLARQETGSPRASRRNDEEDDDDGDSERLGAPAIAAIALTEGSEATAALDRMIAPGEPWTLRKKAAFWLAAARGAAGCRRLVAAVPSDADDGFRKHGTFALSLCKDQATEALLRMARKDSSSKVRSQALFWLAQHAGRKVSEALDQAIRDDPDTEVKKQAVFAFSQMPDGEGIPELIRVARTNRNPEVRERAVFWLGQSNDPRALDFIEEVLTK